MTRKTDPKPISDGKIIAVLFVITASLGAGVFLIVSAMGAGAAG